MGGKAKLDWGLTIFKHIAKASASANTLTIKGPATEEAIRTAVEGIGYTFKGKV